MEAGGCDLRKWLRRSVILYGKGTDLHYEFFRKKYKTTHANLQNLLQTSDHQLSNKNFTRMLMEKAPKAQVSIKEKVF